MSSNSLVGRIIDALTGKTGAEDDCCCGVQIEETESEN